LKREGGILLFSSRVANCEGWFNGILNLIAKPQTPASINIHI